jgi:hypothetical protein
MDFPDKGPIHVPQVQQQPGASPAKPAASPKAAKTMPAPVPVPTPPEPPSLAAAIAAVGTWDDLLPEPRNSMIAALNKLKKIFGAPAESIRLDPEELTRRFRQASPVALGLTAGSLAVYKGHIRRVLRRLGVIRRPPPKRPLTREWQELLERLPDRFTSLKLRDFIGWCSDRLIPPVSVGNGTLAEFAAWRRFNRIKGDPWDFARRCAKTWNRVAQTVQGWPITELTAPKTGFHYTLPFDAYPSSLVADVEAFRHRLSGDGEPGLYTSEFGFDPLRPVSVENRMQGIRMALAALLECGVRREDICSLADIVGPDRMKMILSWHWQRAGRQVTGNVGVIADTLRVIAKYHVRLTGTALDEVLAIAKTAKPKKRSRMTEKNEMRLAQFDDHTVLAMTVNMARECLMPLAAAHMEAGRYREAAWTASLALAIEILLRCPMRLTTLTNLRLGHEIVGLGRDKQLYTHFLIGGVRTKTGEPLRCKISPELCAVIDTVVTEYRAFIGGAASEFLFASRDYDDRPRAATRLGTAMTEAFREHVGIELSPHLFRALAGKLILDENPGAIEEIRLLLGHTTFNTAMQYYISHQPQRAALRHDARMSTLQRRTRALARAAFAGGGKPRRPQLKPSERANGSGEDR